MAKQTKPRTLAEVRDGLCEMYEEVMADTRRCAQVHEGSNALGKVINACKVHLEFCKLADKKPSGEWARFIGEGE